MLVCKMGECVSLIWCTIDMVFVCLSFIGKFTRETIIPNNNFFSMCPCPLSNFNFDCILPTLHVETGKWEIIDEIENVHVC